MRNNRQIPAREPYSYIDSTARSRWSSTAKGSSYMPSFMPSPMAKVFSDPSS